MNIISLYCVVSEHKRITENIPKWFCKIMKYDQSTIKYPWLITAQEGLDQETSFS